jgi:hypothetical protein
MLRARCPATPASDGLRGAYLAVEHLGRVHHDETIGLVVGGMDSPRADTREQGWQQAIRAAGLQDGPIARVDWSREGGYEGGHRLLGSSTPPTAILRARTCRPSACCELRMNAACACPRTLRSSPSTAPRSRSSPGHPSPWWPSRSRRWPEWPSSSYSTTNGPRAIRPLTGNLSSASPAAACESGRRSLAGTYAGGVVTQHHEKSSHDPTLGAVRSRAVDLVASAQLGAGWWSARAWQDRAQFVEAQRPTAALRTFRPSERAGLAKPATAADRAPRAFGADQPGLLRAAYPAHGANALGR